MLRGLILYTHIHTHVSVAKPKNEAGRSLVEMLGMLAIMGILGLTGVKAYTYAMNKHRANELINEAQKRASVVAMQIVAGRDTLSIGEFTNPLGYTFGVEKNPMNENQFNITLPGVDADICTQMKGSIGPTTVIRVISSNCSKLTFNNDLSKMEYASDYNTNEAACRANGYKWCTKGDNGIGKKCIMNTSSCCENIIYDNQCQQCDDATGTIRNIGTATNPNMCDFDGDGNDDSICNDGICPKPGITIDTPCTSNEQCGGEGSGWYCAIAYNAADNRNETQTISNSNCYRNLTGTCKVAKVERLTAAQQAILNTAFGSTILVGTGMNWWSGKNWCEAMGKNMVDALDFDCYNPGTETPRISGYCCKKSELCQTSSWGNLWNGKEILDGEQVAKFSDKMVALRKVYGGGAFHTATPHAVNSENSCNVQTIYTERGDIYGGNGRGVNLKFLCQ